MSRQPFGKFILQGKNLKGTITNTRGYPFEKLSFQGSSFEKKSLYPAENDDADGLVELRKVSAQHEEFDYEANHPSRSFRSEDFSMRTRNGSSSSYSIRRTIMQKLDSKVSPTIGGTKPSINDVRETFSIKNCDEKKPKYIINSHGKFRSIWDLYLCILLVYVAIFVPYRISYLTELTGVLKIVDYLVDASFGIDIMLNFFTSYEETDGTEVWELKRIAMRYLKGFFFLDLGATLPFDLIINETMVASEYAGINQASKLTRLPKLMKILRVMRLLKLLRMYRIGKFIRDLELYYNIHQGISRLLHIWLVVMLVTHFVGCLWHAAGTQLDIEQSNDRCIIDGYDDESIKESLDYGWICREGLIDAGVFRRYISSLYWAFSTLTTVGYGDISAKTTPEQIFSMIMMILGVSWYAYIVGSMTMIVSSFDRVTKQNRGKMMEVNTFIREAQLPKDLGKRIRKYFEYSLSKKKSAIYNKAYGYNADELLLELSSILRNDVITYVERDLIGRIPFFRDKCISFVASTVQLLQPVVVQSGDYIIKENVNADEMYFLIKGRAVVCSGEKVVATLSNGDFFGEVGCIMGGVRKAGVKASTICELQCLSKRNLNLLLGEHPRIGSELKQVARARLNQLKVYDRTVGKSSSNQVDETLGRKQEDTQIGDEKIIGRSQSSKVSIAALSDDNHREQNIDRNLVQPLKSFIYLDNLSEKEKELLEIELSCIIERRVENILQRLFGNLQQHDIDE